MDVAVRELLSTNRRVSGWKSLNEYKQSACLECTSVLGVDNVT